MDWTTHIVLAAKLLESCDCDKGAAVYSELPAIDIKPAHYHRVYAHILENQPDILDAALGVLGSNVDSEYMLNLLRLSLGRVKDKYLDTVRRKIYAYTRIEEQKQEFLKITNEMADFMGDKDIAVISKDKLSAAVSLLSHLYFDTFNNPVQVFLPSSSVCSAQWKFWDSIDYMKFRGNFYEDACIVPFRKAMAESNIWKTSLDPAAMLKAMIIRLGEMGQPGVTYEVVDIAVRDFLRYMDVDYKRVDKEMAFCRKLETEMSKLMSKDFKRKRR